MAENITLYIAGIIISFLMIQLIKSMAGVGRGFFWADVILSLLSWLTVAVVICILVEEDAADE